MSRYPNNTASATGQEQNTGIQNIGTYVHTCPDQLFLAIRAANIPRPPVHEINMLKSKFHIMPLYFDIPKRWIENYPRQQFKHT